MEQVCTKHGLAKTGLCEWCGKPVCDECVTESMGKKYCFTCLARLPLDKLGTINESIGSRGEKNIDPTMSHEEVQEKRKYVEMQMSSDEDMVEGIKNIDAETKHVDKIREEFEDYRKMKKKFDL